MEKLTTAQEERLLQYLDGNLEGAGLRQLRAELETSAAMNARLEELRIVHRTLAHTSLESPSPNFLNNVMRNLQSMPRTNSLSPRKGLWLLAGMVVATGILMAMASTGIFDQNAGIISLEQAAPVKKYFQNSIPTLTLSGKWLIKIVVGLNLVLVFLVLDRTVLRPFFQRRAGMQL